MTYTDLGNGRRERPVNVPNNTAIPHVRVGQINGAPRITSHESR